MKYSLFFLLVLVVLTGCVPSGITDNDKELLSKPLAAWTAEDCEQFLVNQTPTNARRGDHELLAIVFPCAPKMLEVYNWRRYKQHKISHQDFIENTDRQARNCLGVFYDGETGRFVDAGGKFVKDFSQIDSILMIVTLETRSQGLNPLLRTYFQEATGSDNNAMALFLNPAFSPGAFPEIPDLKSRMSIEGRGEYLSSPAYVRNGGGRAGGRKGDLLVMFPVTEGMKRYLQTHNTVQVRLDLGGRPIVLETPLYL